MAKQLIPEELDQLIQEYLTDGVLTDKERAVILRKAEGMGLDHDEIDLYLDAQVQKIDQATDAAARRQKGKTCPYCGGSVLQLTEKCPHCGENITAQASEELQEIFENLEEALVDMKAGKDISRSKATVERFARKAKMYYGSNPKIQKLLSEVESEMDVAEKVAKSKAQKQGIVSIISNKWIWCIVELIVMAAIVMSLSAREAALDEVYHANIHGRIEYYHKAKHAESERNSITLIKWCVILGGIAAVFFTGKQAVKDSKNK